MKKKILSLFLAATMVFSLTACGEKNTNNNASESKKETTTSESKTEEKEESKVETPAEPVKLKIYLKAPKTGSDDAKVSAYVNEMESVKALGVEVEFVRLTGSEYNEKIPLMLAGDEQMDIGVDSGTSFLDKVDQDALVDLSPYLEADDTLLKQIPERYWGTEVKGGIYGIPNWKDYGTQWALYAETEFLKENNIDPSTIKSLADAEVIVEAATKAGRSGWMVSGASAIYAVNFELMDKYDIFENLLVMDSTNPGKFVALHETEEYKELCALMRSWYEKGYISKDAISLDNEQGYLTKGYGLGYTGYSPYAEVAASTAAGVNLTAMVTTETPVGSSGAYTNSLVVYKKSENPELAFKFIQLINTDADIRNAIAFGIPGDHYNLVDGQVELVEGGTDRWTTTLNACGDQRLLYTYVGDPVDKWEAYEEYSNSARMNVAFGMSFDTTPVSNQLANCKAVRIEYQNPLMLGLVEDYEAGIKEMVAKLKEAGLDDIIAEYQRQYDEQKAAMK